MHTFPYFIGRIGGMSFEELDALRFSKLPAALSILESLNEDMKSTIDPLCAALHNEIGKQEDSQVQNHLLNLKRAIYNSKPVKESDLTALDTVIQAELKVLINKHLELRQLAAKGELEAAEIFRLEIAAARKQLQEFTNDEDLQKGLLLSSQTLLGNLKNYRTAAAEGLRKKELKTEESLMKYLTRMTAKTSPFSTFTNLSMGRVTDSGTSVSLISEAEREVVSHICLNNYLFQYLKGLLFKLPDIYRSFAIRPNPTIIQTEEAFSFLTNSNNIEAFQKIPVHPVVELFYELTKEHKDGIVYQQLIQDIIENEYFDAAVEEIEAYINQLVGYGFLEFNIGVSGIDPAWDKTLVKVLHSFETPSENALKLRNVLIKTREQADAYAKANVSERRTIVQQAYENFRSLCFELHEKAGLPADERKTREELEKEAQRIQEEAKAKEKEESTEAPAEAVTEEQEAFMHRSNTYFYFKPEQIFYEDTTTSFQPQISQELATKISTSLHYLLNSLRQFEGFADERERMAFYFMEKYGEQSEVSVMKFYEDYFRDVRKPEAEEQQRQKEETRKKIAEKKENAAKQDNTEVEVLEEEPRVKEAKIYGSIKARQEKNREWLSSFAKKIKTDFNSGDEIKLRREDLPQVEKKRTYTSSGYFLQAFASPDNRVVGVANAAFPGFGKMFSRFLHLLPGELTNALRSENAAHNDKYMSIENCDASFFNANLHPPLMPYEVWMPGGQNSLSGDAQIPVTDLILQYKSVTGLLQLLHAPSRKECFVFDLGFQGHRGRSQLFQLLAKLSLSEILVWGGLNGAINAQYKTDKDAEVTIYPRVIYDDLLVLQRKGWVVKKEALPLSRTTDSEWQVLKRIAEWRRKLKLPEEVFIFITSHNEQELLDMETQKKVGRDGYKPQYINFNSPLLILLLDKMLSKVPVALRIEEMLPSSEQMLRANGKRYVSEFVMQWYD